MNLEASKRRARQLPKTKAQIACTGCCYRSGMSITGSCSSTLHRSRRATPFATLFVLLAYTNYTTGTDPREARTGRTRLTLAVRQLCLFNAAG